jgi:hypothetical protein
MTASFFDASNAWFQYLSALSFTAAAVWAVVKFVHKRWVSTIAEQVNEIHKDNSAILAETKNNGGGSMRDAIDRIEKNQADMAEYIRRVDNALERHLGYHEALDK